MADITEQPETRVVFRTFRGKDGGDTIALFPDIPEDRTGVHVACYRHIGQHGIAHYRQVMRMTRPANPDAMRPLLRELEAIGYTVCVVLRRN